MMAPEDSARASSGGSTGVPVVEHVVLFKFKELTEEQEADMYKGLWTFEEHFPSLMAMSLGRILGKNADHVTHALLMRFGSRVALDTYMADDWRKEIAAKYVVPFFNGELTADFETEVESDLSQLFLDSEKFKERVDHIEMFKVKEGSSVTEVQEFLNSLSELSKNIKANILQLTAGTNFTPNQKYTHALIMRVASVEDLAALIGDPVYVDLLDKVYPVLDDHLRLDFLVDESKKTIPEDIPRKD